MSLETYLLFLLTTTIVVFSPGPAAICIASQGATHGIKKSSFGVLGVASANLVYFLLSATGIAALIIASSLLFSIIKWTGVGYLVYLGLTAIFSKSGGIVVTKTHSNFSLSKLFAKGFIVELANPKALLYFSSLLPQFINLDKSVFIQLGIMGASCLAIDFIAYSLYGYFGERLSKGAVKLWLINLINRTAGSFLIFAGLKMAFVSNQEQ